MFLACQPALPYEFWTWQSPQSSEPILICVSISISVSPASPSLEKPDILLEHLLTVFLLFKTLPHFWPLHPIWTSKICFLCFRLLDFLTSCLDISCNNLYALIPDYLSDTPAALSDAIAWYSVTWFYTNFVYQGTTASGCIFLLCNSLLPTLPACPSLLPPS